MSVSDTSIPRSRISFHRRVARASTLAVTIQLHFRVRRNDGADVAPVEHRAAGLFGEPALPLEQCLADGGVDRHPACVAAGLLAAQARIVEQRVGERGRGERVASVVGVSAIKEHLPADSAVEKTGVEIRHAVMLGEFAGEGALSGSGRSVDGDDHSGSLRASHPRRMPSISIGRSE